MKVHEDGKDTRLLDSMDLKESSKQDDGKDYSKLALTIRLSVEILES